MLPSPQSTTYVNASATAIGSLIAWLETSVSTGCSMLSKPGKLNVCTPSGPVIVTVTV